MPKEPSESGASERNAARSQGPAAEAHTIHLATRKGNLPAVRRMLERGSPVDERTLESRKTPLHVAAQFGQLSAIKCLMEFKADLEARTVFNRTPLHLAAAQGHIVVVEHLLDCKADATARTPDGETPLDLCRKYGYKEVETLLQRRAGLS